MEDLQDFASSSVSAKTIAAELKDDFYSKFVDDFLGDHNGGLLELNEKPLKNRMLVQIGLMREEREISWVNLIQWLQKIIPTHQSADFRSLIERSTTTVLSLKGDARENFLKSNVNCEFVGPICDCIGIGRKDLLEKSDFSDHAKLTGLTNGLVLELVNFIAREKLDPVVLVSWIRNFEPLFCKDGKIRKAYRLLRTNLKNFKIQVRNNQKSRKRRRGLLDEFLQSPFDLSLNAVADGHEYRRGTMIKAHAKKKRRIAVIKEEDEPVVVSQRDRLDETVEQQSQPEPDHNKMPHVISTEEKQGTQSHKRQAQSLDEVEEDPRTDIGDCVTLLDISVLSLQKLTDMYGGKNEAAKAVSMDLLQNHFSTMLKEDANLRSLNQKVMACASSKGGAPLVVAPLNFLHYICLFFSDLIDVIEQQMMSFEKDFVNTTGVKLGRDKHPRFKSFLNFDESAVSRYIHMVSELLCPIEETTPNYRRQWLAFCIERNNPSKLPINRSNRLINYFEAAVGLLHHYEDVALFVSELQLLSNVSDIVLESVNADASDEAMQALVCVLAIVYLKVLGPFWQLLKSDGEYHLFNRYILCLYENLLEWSQDARCLLQPEAHLNVFLQLPIQERYFEGVFTYCRLNAENQNGTLVRACLQKMVKALAAVMEDNLRDFLPGGKLCKELPVDITAQMANSTFSQLMGEYSFGHSYPYEKNRPDKSPGQTSSSVSEEVERELPSKVSPDRPTPPVVMLAPAESIEKHQEVLQRHHMFKGEHLHNTEKMKVLRQKQETQDHIYRKTIVGAVSKKGGPCKSKQDVDRLLAKVEGASHAQKREAIRCELNYQKCIIGSIDNKLDNIGFALSDIVSTVKDVLPNESCQIITPVQNLVDDVENQTITVSCDALSHTAHPGPQNTVTGQQTQNRCINKSIDIMTKSTVDSHSYRENFEFP